jgi:transcriptional regulator with XRE-family HTH domain
MLQNIDYAILGKRIKETRQASGITQEALAEMVSCNTSHISNIENNYTKASLNVLLSIANALNTSIDYLLSNQYNNESLALNNEILRLFSMLPEEKKQQLLRIIKAL